MKRVFYVLMSLTLCWACQKFEQDGIGKYEKVYFQDCEDAVVTSVFQELKVGDRQIDANKLETAFGMNAGAPAKSSWTVIPLYEPCFCYYTDGNGKYFKRYKESVYHGGTMLYMYVPQYDIMNVYGNGYVECSSLTGYDCFELPETVPEEQRLLSIGTEGGRTILTLPYPCSGGMKVLSFAPVLINGDEIVLEIADKDNFGVDIVKRISMVRLAGARP